METQERRKTFALHRNDVLMAKLWVWRRNSEAPLWYHTPFSTFVGLGTGGLKNSCPKLLRLGLRLSVSFMGSSRSYTKAQQPDPSKGAGQADASLCPGDVVSPLKLAVQWATFHFPKGKGGLLHGSALSTRIPAFLGLPFTYTVPEPMAFGALLSLALQIPAHPIRLNSMLHFQNKSLPTSTPRSFACCWHWTLPANIYVPYARYMVNHYAGLWEHNSETGIFAALTFLIRV